MNFHKKYRENLRKLPHNAIFHHIVTDQESQDDQKDAKQIDKE